MFFVLSKILWLVVSPGNFLVLATFVGLLAANSRNTILRRLGHKTSLIAASALMLISFSPIGQWLIAPLENRFTITHPAQVTGVLLLGGDEDTELSAIRNQPIASFSMHRFMAAADLARHYPQATLVYIGGTGRLVSGGAKQEADVARDALTQMGVDTGRMVLETYSRNTYENAVYAARLLHPDPGQTWILVTNAFHMPRAIACFRKAGWNVAPYPSGYFSDGSFSITPSIGLSRNLFSFTLAMHEYIGLVAYWLQGYTDSLWPE